MEDLLHMQYNSVKNARQALLTYCSSINATHLFTPVAAFNGSSIASLLVHSANTYLHWLVFFDSQQPIDYFKDEDIRSLDDISVIYQKVDEQVAAFLHKYQPGYSQAISQYPRSKVALVNTTPLQLFTHAITHEFHHKGQILTMSRMLGYRPVDTDVIRT